ncbi:MULTISPECIES: alpha/beta hydrolase [Bifidobacterium]|uniref:Acetyl-hydrolase n=1 Tax=Bifidobacterium pseudolongum subsp. globosum TaxID=1690 RepID=A0A2N3QQX7_9BIFI|nr:MULTISPECIES: alpha/beta hydrolase [Bifidobacterium]MEE1202374.1 alpha/beta hydrolase [Bifidobacterium sp.]PKU94135.1 acetylhydrolase [Bifidobacterium pseudolongum subsp. globosum]PKV01849.1 acetylhydrolase [Bifidobacterium pseudolongum subsp. globosum]RYQ45900.1 acetyl-hydrolase [Bifidobacterium pseudolongum subsp. globosum]RYQ47642.1 acetyl-hydrolase [Bifidobacterium pseudolongum subsp. globosum]
MASVRGRILSLMTSAQNINPFAHPDAVAKMKKMSEKYLEVKLPKGYSLEKKTTGNGTAYVCLQRNGCKNAKKAIYYLHGGCYICGLTNNYHSFLREFCNLEDGVTVVLLDYKTAPEYKYPVQLNEALDLWDELTENQDYRAENIVIGGDSSGGNLALAMMLKIRDDGRKMPAGAFLLSPWTDMTMSGDSYIRNYPKDVEIGERKAVLTEEKREKLMESGLYSFIGGADRKSPYISPCFGTYEGFPPMFFAVGEDEMLLDDTLDVVEKLKNAKVSVICERKPDMFHTYVLYKNLMPESRESFSEMKRFVQEALR